MFACVPSGFLLICFCASPQSFCLIFACLHPFGVPLFSFVQPSRSLLTSPQSSYLFAFVHSLRVLASLLALSPMGFMLFDSFHPCGVFTCFHPLEIPVYLFLCIPLGSLIPCLLASPLIFVHFLPCTPRDSCLFIPAHLMQTLACAPISNPNFFSTLPLDVHP